MPEPRPDLIYINRLADPINSWNLRFRFQGKFIHRQMFRDEVYGGREQALAAAKKKRDLLAQCVGVDLGNRPKRCRYYHSKPSKRSSTGVSGVYKQDPYWRAEISFEVFKSKYRLFSIRELGNEEAFQQACRQRDIWEQEFVEKNSKGSIHAKTIDRFELDRHRPLDGRQRPGRF